MTDLITLLNPLASPVIYPLQRKFFQHVLEVERRLRWGWAVVVGWPPAKILSVKNGADWAPFSGISGPAL